MNIIKAKAQRPYTTFAYQNKKSEKMDVRRQELIERKRILQMPDLDEVPALVNGSLDELQNRYLTWLRNDVIYAVEKTFTYYNAYGHFSQQTQTIYRRAAKRGNREYIRAIKECVREYNERLPSIQFFNPRDRSKIQKTSCLYLVLTTNPKKFKSRYEAWRNIGKEVNKFVSNLKRYFDCEVHISRSWECFYQKALGYPHVNLIVLLKNKTVDCFHQIRKHDKKSVWRIRKKSEIAKFWKWGFIDVFAISQIKNASDYDIDFLNKDNDDDEIREGSVLSVPHMVKYLTKNLRKKNNEADKKTIILNALLWVLRKRSFSLSNQFFYISEEEHDIDLINAMSNSNIFALETRISYTLLGVFPACINQCRRLNGGKPPPSCPYLKKNGGYGRCPYEEQ